MGNVAGCLSEFKPALVFASDRRASKALLARGRGVIVPGGVFNGYCAIHSSILHRSLPRCGDDARNGTICER